MRRSILPGLLFATFASSVIATTPEPVYTNEFPLEDCHFTPSGGNPFEHGDIVSHDGAWLAGKNGAEPGIIMTDSGFLVGTRYFQELAPDVALDRAEHVAFDLEVVTSAGAFDDCIRVTETSPLEPGHESVKLYCPHVGLRRRW